MQLPEVCQVITTTEGHPFFVSDKGWVIAKELAINDRLVSSDGREKTVSFKSIQQLESPVKVYNFAVEDYHTYYVGSGVLVHNNCGVKKAPNPNGKKGGAEHQKVIREIIDDAKNRGLEVKTEMKFDVVGGYKKTRYADVAVLEKGGNLIEIHQVGKVTKAGNPISREVKALTDIIRSKQYNGAKLVYHAYNFLK